MSITLFGRRSRETSEDHIREALAAVTEVRRLAEEVKMLAREIIECQRQTPTKS